MDSKTKFKEINIIDWSNRHDKKVIQHIVDNHYIMLCSIVDKYCYKSSTANRSDLIAEGSIGLLKAIKSFDETKNNKFSTYAYFWIKNKILSYVNNSNNIKGNNNKNTRILYDVHNIADITIDNSSIKKSTTIDSEDLHKTYINSFSIFLNTLSENEKFILNERILKSTSLDKISKKIGYSREKVRQIEIKQIKNFKDFLTNVMKIDYMYGFIMINFIFYMSS